MKSYKIINASKVIQIHENGTIRATTMDELVQRRAAGEKFLKMKGKPIYVLTEAEKHAAIMRPIWREDKREKRSWECIYKGRSCCAGHDCDSCTDIVYSMDSLEHLQDCGNDVAIVEDVETTFFRKVLYCQLAEAMRELDETDAKILRMTADGVPERDIAAELGFKSKTSVVKRKEKTILCLQKRLKKFL